ncbi:GNAT family N-acetyltransferase, partial [Yasminevirus sp. GU-2018]
LSNQKQILSYATPSHQKMSQFTVKETKQALTDSKLTVRVALIEEKTKVIDKIRAFWDEPVEWAKTPEVNEEIFHEEDYADSCWGSSEFCDKTKEVSKYPLIALNGDEIVGFCHIVHDQRKDADCEWIILDFATFNPFRRYGFGSKFVTDIIAFCKKNSVNTVCKIEASSHIDNKPAIAFWNKNGFATIATDVSFAKRDWAGLYNLNVYSGQNRY